ncbi:hypothetical protein ACJJJB_16265 [Microbulbifer sp. ANSA001]|uniref:hypothetical protein n=1 Tax=Microbulbifer sp. ANSA001 TaxID=3243358 RepID=UPI004041F0E9
MFNRVFDRPVHYGRTVALSYLLLLCYPVVDVSLYLGKGGSLIFLKQNPVCLYSGQPFHVAVKVESLTSASLPILVCIWWRAGKFIKNEVKWFIAAISGLSSFSPGKGAISLFIGIKVNLFVTHFLLLNYTFVVILTTAIWY